VQYCSPVPRHFIMQWYACRHNNKCMTRTHEYDTVLLFHHLRGSDSSRCVNCANGNLAEVWLWIRLFTTKVETTQQWKRQRGRQCCWFTDVIIVAYATQTNTCHILYSNSTISICCGFVVDWWHSQSQVTEVRYAIHVEVDKRCCRQGRI